MSFQLRDHIKLINGLIIIKLSSLAVTKESGGVDLNKIKKIVKDISELKQSMALDIIIVSSGAVNAGKGAFKKFHKEEVRYQQASSAVGQPLLMNAFNKEFLKQSITCAQVLLTHEDLKSKTRSYNIRNSLETLLDNNTIPIINENDSVSFDEITLGDNDQLSAMIGELMNADLLCILTKADGLFDMDPEDPRASRFEFVDFSESFSKVKLASKTSAGKGGMKTKLQAVRKLTPIGIDVIISSFNAKSPILRALGQNVGTYFLGKTDTLSKKNAWILTRVRPEAIIKVDSGAYQAIVKNASLLPIGIVGVSGKFSRGDSVTIKYKNKVIAFGLAEYSTKEVVQIMGLKSSQLQGILTNVPSKVVIHKNNLLLR